MSDAKKFGNVELTLEQRLEELERKIPVFLDKIQINDQIIDVIKNLKNQVSGVIENVKSHSTLLEDSNSTIASIQADSNSKSSLIESTNQTQKNDVKSINDKLSGLIDSNNKLRDEITNLKSTHSNFSKKSDVSAVYDDIQKKNNSLSDDLKFHKEDTQNLKNEISNIKETLSRHDADSYSAKFSLDKHDKDISDVKYVINNTNDRISDLSRGVEDKFLGFENLINAIDQKANSMKSDFKPATFTKEEIKEELSQKLSIVGLDASNANLKASNNAQQITILEKKLENIFLLLKKHELTQ